MQFKKTNPREDLPYKAKDTFKNLEGTLEEFAQFISKFADEEGKEIVFFRDKGNAYAFIEEDSALYIFESGEDVKAGIETFKDTSKAQEVIDKSKLFMNTMLVFLMVLASCLPTI